MVTDDKEILELISNGELEIVGRLVDASNASLLCKIAESTQVIYKPIAGERPLWDFPDGNLASREVATYYLSKVGKFNLVPPTVLRDGPFGLGAVQYWIDVDKTIDVVEHGQLDHPGLRKMALFDCVINNTDRKFGHILFEDRSSVYGCDHGVSLHSEDKLRTVLWQWSGDPLSTEEITQLKFLNMNIDIDILGAYITKVEIDSLFRRIETLLSEATFPTPSQDWPAVPWPPY